MSRRRLLLVSLKLPVSIEHFADGHQRLVHSSGGLVAGLEPVHQQGEGLWFGAMSEVNAQIYGNTLTAKRLVPVTVSLPDKDLTAYANRVLWPLSHYALEHVDFTQADFEAYTLLNQSFANAVVAQARDNDIIWVHDYQLMLLPNLLRAQLPKALIGFFLHIPFPSSEVFRILPGKEAILQGLLGANLIGLHTYDYARHLISTFRRVLGEEFDDDWVLPNGGVRVGVFPLGIDPQPFIDQAAGPRVSKRLARLHSQVQGRKVVLGVDRMDYSKGLLQRLDGFSLFLSRHPSWRERVVLMQVSVPSRTFLADYRRLKEEVERRIGQINGQFQKGGLAPISYMYRQLTLEELVSLYALADVMLVTPIRDGMNLVAKEYVATRLQDDGVLVLSEFAGAAAEMGEALLVNPYDAGSIDAALQRALYMDTAEQQARMHNLRQRVLTYTVHTWVTKFLDALVAFTPMDEQANTMTWQSRLLNSIGPQRRLLLALDYDGTLVDLTVNPAMATPDDALLDLLRALRHLKQVETLIISGRDHPTLGQWLAPSGVHIVAEHGLYQRHADTHDWQLLESNVDLSWKQRVREIFTEYVSRTPGSLIEEKPSTVVWHYRGSEQGFGSWAARELVAHLREMFAGSPVAVVHGDKLVEARPMGINKGKALMHFVETHGPFDVILAMGDDRTDEDMFAAAPEQAWTVKVGNLQGHTHARYRIGQVSAVRQLLQQICDLCRAA